ncbi:ovate family protein [Striga asiatica]|uniref:Transcription repressor n=1 Tax=Striga asiatica TaxID=4170 RepID=A0A5A7QHQ7_STRAF|nr:ovate family protein [Striga asiatica]
MSSLMWKSFNLCFSKFKCFPSIAFSPPPPAIDELDQDPRFSDAGGNNNPSIFKNFNSLYDANSCCASSDHLSKSLTFSTTTTAAAGAATDDFLSSSDDDGDSGDDPLPDFTSAFASNRFFLSSPGRSNSIFDRPPPPAAEDGSGAVVGGGVAVDTYSPDPYADFRRSMVEMIEARNYKADWEFLNELLLCYLSLNPKHAHKYIVEAFSDVVVSLVLPAPAAADGGCGRNQQLRRSATLDSSV